MTVERKQIKNNNCPKKRKCGCQDSDCAPAKPEEDILQNHPQIITCSITPTPNKQRCTRMIETSGLKLKMIICDDDHKVPFTTPTEINAINCKRRIITYTASKEKKR